MKTNHTFVICAYGDSPYLKECIVSLKNQTVRSEIILYTSTPSKHIEQLCKQYAIPYHTSSGGGIGEDWNYALSFASSRYVTIAHQDDLYKENYAEQVLAEFSRHSNHTIVYSDYAEYRDNQEAPANTNLKIKTLMLQALALFPNWRFWRNRILAFGNAICCPAVTYDMEKLSGFQFETQMRTNLDWYAWYDISTHYKGSFGYISEKLMYHRIHQESETSNTIRDNVRTKEDTEMYRLFWPEFMVRILIHFYEKSQESNG
ncbi:glycosyltransferase family A protein [Streptococcus ruminantium]|uniref:Glycosyltransferase family A protein n=1 Tax=Streptococcus ruminantium TaxID=1917441 RepID=A0ABU1B4S6_9STRE|nr:glycosyltransferase family A protein [Streptococcus ruminantium]MDQ8759941.1 glycosyltransferase family A protein [Streptococcus ruminantium]MDQ8765226.1 glycosyltransferase family A protein [Streptococcus ruminantium]MDQ8769687.1 glycosyltransferase family A protein [Streptococcus ruminantium]MDQ8775068.1 glycosyltransferase family A protein [Streptococcus ruminantium]MDQ8794277.1 glycosyltransferase family A protein [Streptococcus ruminantium]